MFMPIHFPSFYTFPKNPCRRRSFINRDSGSKLSYDSSWTGPLNVKRSMTNIPALIIFILLFIYWVGVTCYAFVDGDLKKSFASISDSDPNIYLTSSVKALCDVKWIIIGILLIAVLLSLFYLVLLRITTEAMFYWSLFLILVTIVLIMSWFSYLLVKAWPWNQYDKPLMLARNIIISILLVWTIILLPVAGTEEAKSLQVACEIIQELTKAVVFFPSLFIYSLLVYTILFAMAGVCIAVQWSLQSIDGLPESYLIINYIIEILCLIWFNCFLSAFLKLIASGSYATWYWTRNKQEVPKITTMRFIGITLRYYMGTSTICSCIMPASHGLTQAYMMLHGTTYLESAKCASNLLHRNERVNKIYEKVKDVGFYIWISIGSGSCILYKAVLLIMSMEESQSSWAQLFACFIIFRTVYWMFGLLQVAVDTVFICIFEDFEVNGNSVRPHYMSDKLKMLISEIKIEQ